MALFFINKLCYNTSKQRKEEGVMYLESLVLAGIIFQGKMDPVSILIVAGIWAIAATYLSIVFVLERPNVKGRILLIWVVVLYVFVVTLPPMIPSALMAKSAGIGALLSAFGSLIGAIIGVVFAE